MDGRILHEWEYVLPTVVEPKRRFWRRMHLFPNGDALAIFEGRGGGIAKVDKDSNEIWALSNGAHHDLHVEADGTIYVLTRTVEVDPALDPRLPIHHDRVTKLSPEGELLEEWSIIEALRGTPWEADLVYRDGGDLLHTNTLEVLDGSHAGGHRAFRAGRFLLSFRGTNALAVLDPFLRKVVWYEKGPWNAQHQPTLLPNGNVLLLNNNSDGAVLAPGANNDWRVATAGDAGGPSEILEYDPVSREVVWRYAGTPGEKKFYTSLAGSVARLPNGNLLASLSFQGRALEVTPDGRIVWEYRTPFAIDGRVANSPEFVRLPADFPLDWARGAQVPGRSPRLVEVALGAGMDGGDHAAEHPRRAEVLHHGVVLAELLDVLEHGLRDRVDDVGVDVGRREEDHLHPDRVHVLLVVDARIEGDGDARARVVGVVREQLLDVDERHEARARGTEFTANVMSVVGCPTVWKNASSSPFRYIEARSSGVSPWIVVRVRQSVPMASSASRAFWRMPESGWPMSIRLPTRSPAFRTPEAGVATTVIASV